MIIQNYHRNNINKDVVYWATSCRRRHYAEPHETLTSIHSLFLSQSLLYFSYIIIRFIDFNMVSEPLLGCWADLPPYYCPRVWLVRHTWGGILKRESCPTLTKYYWVVQFISHRHPSSLKMSFEIELGLLDFNLSLDLVNIATEGRSKPK